MNPTDMPRDLTDERVRIWTTDDVEPTVGTITAITGADRFHPLTVELGRIIIPWHAITRIERS